MDRSKFVTACVLAATAASCSSHAVPTRARVATVETSHTAMHVQPAVTHVETDAAVANDTSTQMVSPPDGVDEQLARRMVTNDDFYRSELYTWTTPDQIAALRATPVLLTAEPNSGGFLSRFNRLLLTLARGTTQQATIARHLMNHPILRKRRYAWPSPFATVMGLGERAYGSALVRIELRPEALIGRLDDTQREPLIFVDRSGNRVALGVVVRAIDRIAAIYHVRPNEPIPFREYVVCNEAMVARWSLGTDTIRKRVESDQRFLHSLDDELAQLHLRGDRVFRHTHWMTSPGTANRFDAWQSVIAFANARYVLGSTTLRAMDRTLAGYDPTPPALEHEVQFTFVP